MIIMVQMNPNVRGRRCPNIRHTHRNRGHAFLSGRIRAGLHRDEDPDDDKGQCVNHDSDHASSYRQDWKGRQGHKRHASRLHDERDETTSPDVIIFA